jgi:DnaJ-class molecular chaperone
VASVSIYEEILGVSANDSEQVIKKAFRAKAKKLHPDVNTSIDAHDKFILLQEAYDCLINLKKVHPYSNDPGINFDDWIRNHQQGARQRAREKARTSIKGILEKLPTGNFIRIHRSYIIPRDKIESVRSKSVYVSGTEIPIGTSYQEDFINSFKK